MRGCAETASPLSKLAWLLPAAVAVIILAPYTVTSFIYTGDLRDVYIPLEDFYRSELRQGRLPLWDPKASFGFPVLASSQIGFWYPPLFALRLFHPEAAFVIAYVGHALLLFLGLFWYARKLGQSNIAATLAAVAFTGSGFMIGHLPHANVFFGIAWVPLALLLTDTLADALRPRTALALSVVLAVTALTGHFQIAFLVIALSAARLLYRLRQTLQGVPWQHTLWTWTLFTVPMLAGVVLLTTAQLLPTLELVRESTRGPGGGFDLARANQHSFPPWQAISFLVPAFYGFPDLSEYWGKRPLIEMAAWIGVIPLLLAVVGAFGPRASGIGTADNARGPNSHAPGPTFWTAIAVAGFMLALGQWSPVRLLGLEPTLGIFSGPARYLVLTEFSLAILAGIGLDRVQTRPSQRIRAVGIAGLLAAVLIAAGFAFLRVRPESLQNLGERAVDAFVVSRPEHVLSRAAYSDKVRYLIGRLSAWGVNLGNPKIALSFVLLAAGSAVVLVSSRGTATNIGSTSTRQLFLALALVTATALELVVVAWQVHPRVAWSEVVRESPVAVKLREEPRGRLYVVHPQGDTGLLFANRTTRNRDEHERLLRDLAVPLIYTRAGIPGIEWPAALDLARVADVLTKARDEQGQPVDNAVLDRLGVRYVAGSAATPGLTLPPPARELLSVPSADGATIRLWERPTARPRVELFSAFSRDIDQLLPENVGHANITIETPQHLEIHVENPLQTDGVLVLRDTLYPGWRAAVDGVPVAVERAETIFRAVPVPPGRHTVAFRYQPRSVPVGIALSLAGWFGAIIFGLRRRPLGTT